MYANKKSLNNKSLFIKHHFHIHVHISNLYLSPRTEKRELSRYMWRRDGDEWWKYNRVKKIVQNFTRCVIFQMTCLTLSIFLRLRAKGITSHPIFSKFIFFFSFSWAKQNNHFSIYSYENVNISKQPSPLVSCLYLSFIKNYDLTSEEVYQNHIYTYIYISGMILL